MFSLLSRLQSSDWVSHYLYVFFSNVIPHHSLQTPQIPTSKPHSSLYPVSLSHRILATDIGKEGSRCGAQTRASEANKSRRLVVTSISIFKYLTEQISGCLRDDSCCSEIPFLAAGRQLAFMPIFSVREPVRFLPFKDTCAHSRCGGRQIKSQREGEQLRLPRSGWRAWMKLWLSAICSYGCLDLDSTLSS